MSPHFDPYWHPLIHGHPPPWVDEWAEDRAGVWVGIKLGKVSQRLRWIPAGRFMMGSPTTEAGRWDERESPQHEVIISKGFWLFDTPVTQALWEAVMGDNPSYFPDPQRPVEQVSWEDCQRFLEAINERRPGLELCLPTEAQWEYACRAGTKSATYAGDLEILGENNAPVLDEIAWYGGNSGVEFDLKKGVDSSGWSNKQYDHKQAGTRKVGLKKRNPWRLYDMLGNVLEWCADGMREYSEEAQIDPVGPLDDGSSRVVRGGSWGLSARSVRAAYRVRIVPGLRSDIQGFRCARVQT